MLLLGIQHSDSVIYIYACIGEGSGNPLQNSCLENPRDSAAWRASLYGVAQGKGDAAGPVPHKTVCVYPGGLGEQLYCDDSRAGLQTQSVCGLCTPLIWLQVVFR